jgi:hypothetical protein
MNAIQYARGEALDWTNHTGGDVVGGQPVVLGDTVGVALMDIP